eukprot:519282_1
MDVKTDGVNGYESDISESRSIELQKFCESIDMWQRQSLNQELFSPTCNMIIHEACTCTCICTCILNTPYDRVMSCKKERILQFLIEAMRDDWIILNYTENS